MFTVTNTETGNQFFTNNFYEAVQESMLSPYKNGCQFQETNTETGETKRLKEEDIIDIIQDIKSLG